MVDLYSEEDALARSVMELVSIKALSGNEAPAADHIERKLTDAGLSVCRDEEDNLLALVEPRNPGPERDTIHISGHMDTVVPVEGWQNDPFTAIMEGSGEHRKVVGLGASDMRSGLAIMIRLARHYAMPEHRPERLRLAFSFTICEETPVPGKRNGVHKILARQPGRWAVTTEASCEAECPTVALGCQGHAVCKFELRGRSAHSACPERGLNAIHAAAKLCTRVERLNQGYRESSVLGDVRARASSAVTLIKGGSAGNIIPECCEVTVSRRLAPGEQIKTVEQECAWLVSNLEGVTAKWSLRCDAPACSVDLNGPLLRAANDASRTLFGQCRHSWNRARTDMVLFSQAGMDVLNIGPGFAGQAHVAGEFVRTVDVPRSAGLLLATIDNLDRWLATGSTR